MGTTYDETDGGADKPPPLFIKRSGGGLPNYRLPIEVENSSGNSSRSLGTSLVPGPVRKRAFSSASADDRSSETAVLPSQHQHQQQHHLLQQQPLSPPHTQLARPLSLLIEHSPKSLSKPQLQPIIEGQQTVSSLPSSPCQRSSVGAIGDFRPSAADARGPSSATPLSGRDVLRGEALSRLTLGDSIVRKPSSPISTSGSAALLENIFTSGSFEYSARRDTGSDGAVSVLDDLDAADSARFLASRPPHSRSTSFSSIPSSAYSSSTDRSGYSGLDLTLDDLDERAFESWPIDRSSRPCPGVVSPVSSHHSVAPPPSFPSELWSRDIALPPPSAASSRPSVGTTNAAAPAWHGDVAHHRQSWAGSPSASRLGSLASGCDIYEQAEKVARRASFPLSSFQERNLALQQQQKSPTYPVEDNSRREDFDLECRLLELSRLPAIPNFFASPSSQASSLPPTPGQPLGHPDLFARSRSFAGPVPAYSSSAEPMTYLAGQAAALTTPKPSPPAVTMTSSMQYQFQPPRSASFGSSGGGAGHNQLPLPPSSFLPSGYQQQQQQQQKQGSVLPFYPLISRRELGSGSSGGKYPEGQRFQLQQQQSVTTSAIPTTISANRSPSSPDKQSP